MAESLAALDKVRRGLALMLIGFALSELWYIFWLVWFAFSGPPEGLPFPTEWLLSVPPTLFLLIYFAGQVFCLFVPEDAQARGFMLGSLVLGFLAVALAASPLVPGVPLWVLLLSSLAGKFAYVLVLVFLGRVARYIEVGDLENEAGRVLVYWVLLQILPLLGVLGAYLLVPRLLLVGFVVLLGVLVILFVLWLLTLILFVNLLSDLLQAIRRHEDTIAQKERETRAGWMDQPPW
jgi:uncharacterized membrane protein